MIKLFVFLLIYVLGAILTWFRPSWFVCGNATGEDKKKQILTLLKEKGYDDGIDFEKSVYYSRMLSCALWIPGAIVGIYHILLAKKESS